MMNFGEWVRQQPGYDEGVGSFVKGLGKAALKVAPELVADMGMGFDVGQAVTHAKNLASTLGPALSTKPDPRQSTVRRVGPRRLVSPLKFPQV